MKKIVLIFMLTLGFAWNCHAQTWTYVQDSLITYCVAGASSCTFTSGNILPTTAGTVWVVAVNTTNNVTISSVTGGGGTWQLCPASSCHIFSSTPVGNMDFAYNLTGNTGTSSITVNLSGNSGAIFGGNFFELLPPAGSTASFDAAGTNSSASCQPCTGVGLTLSATDAVIQNIFGNSPFSWNAWSSPYLTLPVGEGLNLNATSGAAPTVTVKTPANGAVFNAIAFKSTAGSFTPPTLPMSVVNFTSTGLTGVSCNPSCSVTVPSIGSGHLLYLQAGTLSGVHIASVSGGGAWVTTCPQASIPSTSDTLSCAYVLSSTSGATSINVTMSGSASIGLSFWEIASTSGPFTLDVQGSATNSASYSPGGVPLTLTGTNDAIFQAIFVPGGTSGVTFYPYPRIPGQGPQFMEANAAQATLLNAKSGVVPFWANEQGNVTAVTGIAFRTGTALAPPTGLAAVVH